MRPEVATSVRRLPMGLKLAFTAFVAVHVAVNWAAYGPTNFLWMCDVAVLTLGVALWTESSLLLSIAAVGIFVPLLLWEVDLAVRVLGGHYWFGFAGYMFDRRVPTAVRATSSFHIWLPLVLGFALHRIGYDRRAWASQCVIIAVLLTLCRVVSSPPPRHGSQEVVNVNWVYGLSDDASQTRLSGMTYLGAIILGYQFLFYLPTHCLLAWYFKAGSASVGRLKMHVDPADADSSRAWLGLAVPMRSAG